MNYDELLTACKAYADRTDSVIDDNFDAFVSLAEAKMNRLIRTRKQSVRAYIETLPGEEYYCLPNDFSKMEDIQVNSGLPGSVSYSVEFKQITEFNSLRNRPYVEGDKRYYCIVANSIEIYPTLGNGETIEIVYIRKVPHLTSSNQTNWMLSDHPDVYLSGLVSEIELFVKNYDVSNMWQNRMSNAIAEIESSNEKELWDGPPLNMRVG